MHSPPQQEGFYEQGRYHVGRRRIGFGIGRVDRQRPNTRRFEPFERKGAERNDHPQDGMYGFWPLVPAGHAPDLRPGPLLVRSLLVSDAALIRRCIQASITGAF